MCLCARDSCSKVFKFFLFVCFWFTLLSSSYTQFIFSVSFSVSRLLSLFFYRCLPSRTWMCMCVRRLNPFLISYISYIVYRAYSISTFYISTCICPVSIICSLACWYTCKCMRAQSNNNDKRVLSLSLSIFFVVAAAAYYCTFDVRIFHCSFCCRFFLFDAGIEQLFARELLQFSFVLYLDFDAHTGDDIAHSFAHLSYLFI